MAKETLEVKTLDDLRKLRATLNQSKKKQANADTEFVSIPTEGVFDRIDIKEFTLTDEKGKETKVQSLGLFTKNGEFISENTLTKQNLGEVLTSVKTGKRKGLFILKSDRLTNLNKFGSTLNEQMLNIVGKSFTTEKRDVRNYQQKYLTSETFDEVCQKYNTEECLRDALSKTEIVNGYVFNIS
jgi:hypothetical protein